MGNFVKVCRGGAGGELCQMLFWKSRRMASVCILLSILCARLSMSWISCVSVERCFLNPCCASWSCMISLVIMCSSILQVMDVSDIGRWLMGCRRSPFLNMGTTLGVVQSVGIAPCFNEAWKNSVNMGVSSSASVFCCFVFFECA